MDKNKGIWITIACILVIGIVVTLSTNRFVTKQEQSLASTALETSKAAAAQKSRALETAAVQTDITALVDQEEKGSAVSDSLTLEETKGAEAPAMMGVLNEAEGDLPVAIAEIPEAVAESETIQSPLKNAKTPELLLADDTQNLGSYYKQRLDELDVQIQKMKDSDKESTTYSMKTNAEKELKIWDNELNIVYNEILNLSDEEDANQLIEEERQWMKMRDAAALESSQKYSGGTMEGLEYTATMATYTRDRAYDLVAIYLVSEDE